MKLQIATVDATQSIDLRISNAVIAGWTGRDASQVEHHIAELERIGVRRPSTIPAFYRVGASLVTTDTLIDVVGEDSSGEAEFVLFDAGQLLVGVGSDHTDRRLEAVSVAQSKQVCPKPVAPTVWRFADVEPHWDRLELRSFIVRDGDRVRYQSGSVAKMLHPRDLLQRFSSTCAMAHGTAMFCGTLSVEGDICASHRFEVELHDPVLHRSLQHAYEVRALPVVS